MALAAVKDGQSRRHLAPVETGVSLAGRLAAAQAAVTEPQRRVSELEAALAAALEKSDYAAAAEVQGQLPAAREALALAEVDVRVITEAQAALNAVADAERRQVAEARRHDEAERMLEAACAAEQEAREGTSATLAVMRSHLVAAKAAYQEAQRIEARVLQAQRQGLQYRRTLGEWPAHHPGPTVTGSNECQVLADTDKLIRELARWRP